MRREGKCQWNHAVQLLKSRVSSLKSQVMRGHLIDQFEAVRQPLCGSVRQDRLETCLDLRPET